MQEAPDAAHAARLETEASGKSLNDVYDKIGDLHEDLAIVEDVLRAPESGLPDEERKGLQESREAMLAQLKKLEEERGRLTEEADPEEAKAIEEAWTSVRTIRQGFEAPMATAAPQPEKASALKAFWQKIRPENWTKKGREQRDWRKSQVAEYATIIAECESELEKLKGESVDVKKLSIEELTKISNHYIRRTLSLDRRAGSKDLDEELKAMRPADREEYRAAYEMLLGPINEAIQLHWKKQAAEKEKEAAENPEASEGSGKSTYKPSSVNKLMGSSSARRSGRSLTGKYGGP